MLADPLPLTSHHSSPRTPTCLLHCLSRMSSSQGDAPATLTATHVLQYNTTFRNATTHGTTQDKAQTTHHLQRDNTSSNTLYVHQRNLTHPPPCTNKAPATQQSPVCRPALHVATQASGKFQEIAVGSPCGGGCQCRVTVPDVSLGYIAAPSTKGGGRALYGHSTLTPSFPLLKVFTSITFDPNAS